MEVFESCSINKTEYKKCVLALGNFDGVHMGHRQLLSKAKEYAKEKGLSFGVYTFKNHPRFSEDSTHALLTTNNEKASLISCFEPDFIYFEDFQRVKDFSPCDFVKYIYDSFGCECAVCGENFTFGKGAVGDTKLLCKLMAQNNKHTIVVPMIKVDGQSVSSSLIRNLLSEGDAVSVAKLLEYEYMFTSKIIHGASLGNKLGFPTINQRIPENKILPKFGVYASIVVVEGKEYIGVTNIGVKPTVSKENGEVLAETYIVGFYGDVYEKYATVSLCKMLRDEKKFSSLDELKDGIRKDVENTVSYFKGK